MLDARTTAQGSELSGTTPARARPWPLILAVSALCISLVALAISIEQTSIARQDASAARSATDRLSEGLARKVFLDVDFESVTVSNVGTLPVRDVTVYRADDHGHPVAELAFQASLPGCEALRWTGDVRAYIAVSFRDADGRGWLVSSQAGLQRQQVTTYTPREPRNWDLAITPIHLCS